MRATYPILEEQPIPHSGIAAVERWMVGEDILFARHIDKSRLQFECDCVECECYKDGIEALFEELKSSSVCSCGRLNVDNFIILTLLHGPQKIRTKKR